MSARFALLLVGSFGLAACVTDVDLSSNRTPLAAPTSHSLGIGGVLCTPVVDSPIKIVIALDASQSMSVTDPSGSRSAAVVALLDGMPQDPAVSVAVMLFQGTTTTWLTQSGQAEFERVVDLDPSARNLLSQRILNFVAPGTDSTDFLKPISDIYSLLFRDIASHVGDDETRARYSVVFLSDGQPTTDQDDELLCGDAVRRIRVLRELADEVTVNTVHVFTPQLGACAADAGVVTQTACGFVPLPQTACPKLLVDQNAQRLERMAQLGGGTFQDFRAGAPVAFNLAFAPVHRRLVLDKVVASNFSAPAGSPAGLADSDTDGLLDGDEQTGGTSPLVADTDGDGFSDGVEVFSSARGGTVDPLQMDPGCPVLLRRVDTDCDGLTDCDEQLIGTSSTLIDTDSDGVPDAVEFKLGSQPSSRDLTLDPDQDSLTTGFELSSHLDPQRFDASPVTADYRYVVTPRAALEPDGSQCWDFLVSNLTLVDTGDGINDLFLSYSMVWEDQPAGRTFMRKFRRAAAFTGPTALTVASGDFGVCR